MKSIILCIAAAFLLAPGVSGARGISAKGQEGPVSPDAARADVEAHPDSLSAHQRFIKAFEQSIPGFSYKNTDSVLRLLEPQYAVWMKRFPGSATVPFALGDAFTAVENPRGRPFLLKAVALDSSLLKGWMDLMEDADMAGNFEVARTYLKKAQALDPDNPQYAAIYANTFQETDPTEYRRLNVALADRFPHSNEASGALYWAAYRSPDRGERITLYERMRSQFPATQYSWTINGMANYFDLLLPEEPAKALALAQYMTGLKLDEDAGKDWTGKAALARTVSDASKLLEAHDATGAVKLLAGVRLDRWSDAREGINRLKARALDGTGNTEGAYDSLLVFYAKEPSDEIRTQMLRYAEKMGKDEVWMEEGIQGRRIADSKPAPVFTLTDYLTHRPVSLEDYRGKVVLLTFWYPGCGPCRGEFPDFQKVLDKFRDRDIAFLGVNVVLSQDEYVEPLMKTTGYTFTPLRDDSMWATGAYKVRGTPSNFVIDPEGRIVFSGFMIQSPRAERMLELMIGSLLPKQETDSLSALRASVETYPDSLSLHERYIKAFEQSIPGMNYKNADSVIGLLESQYAAWMKRFPQSAAVPFALGHAYANAESPHAKPFLLRAVALDPKLAEAYEDLWIDAERWGDFKASQAYLKDAMDAEPSNPDYAFYYATTFETSDPDEYRRLSLEVVRKFPESERGAQALYWLANRSADPKDKVAIYEELRSKFPPGKFNWSASGMSDYFALLLPSDPIKAQAIAQSMAASSEDDKKEWNEQAALAENVSEARKLLEERKASDAVKLLSGIKLNNWSQARESINLLKAKALDASGNTTAAYDSLLVFYAKEPSVETGQMMVRYAAKMGKDSAWVDADILRQRDATAKPAPVFKLAAYLTNDSISLADYRGKVVLLTFWFPGCGPCRGEFPHFQAVLSKFQGKAVSYVGINVLPDQDPYVVPFMKSSGYGFTPLRDNNEWSQKAYKVRGEPTNFLIDQNGRIIFSGFMIQNEKAQQMLELMIGSLLEKKA